MDKWDEQKVCEYILDGLEEGHTLEYKAAKSLGRSNREKDEITKDVSSMANASGGTIIYGVAEFHEPDKKHLPEKLDAIDRTAFSKEWLEHIIGNVQPRIPNVIIHSVTLSSGPNDVAYVVEIPSSTTAHQATGLKYYRRYNFECLAMKDQEIRDVMNRATTPDMAVEFSYQRNQIENHEHHYTLGLKLKNLSGQVINHFQLKFTFPKFGNNISHVVDSMDNVDVWISGQNEVTFIYRSNKVCFPVEEIDIGRDIAIQYMMNSQTYSASGISYGRGPMVKWTLYADNMTPKTGEKPFEELQCF
jgi:hypothetical protein